MKVFTIIAACLFLLTGCSTITTYNQSLKDYEGDDRVGNAFGVEDTSFEVTDVALGMIGSSLRGASASITMKSQQIRVYPETLGCIDLYAERNGFVSGNTFGDSVPDNKRIGVPEVEGMSDNRVEFWVSAKNNISIRTLYTSNKNTVSDSLVSFKPEVGAFYYVVVDMKNVDPTTLKYLRVYKITQDAEGKRSLKHVDNIPLIKDCSGQRPWYTKMGSVI